MKPAARHKARRHAIQALYQVLFTQESASSIQAQHLERMAGRNVDEEYFRQIVSGVLAELQDIDDSFVEYLDRPLAEITPIELCVVRLATFEFKHYLEVPYRVVLNEALKLTQTFGTQDGYKFVNGVLDKVARKLRHLEYQADHVG